MTRREHDSAGTVDGYSGTSRTRGKLDAIFKINPSNTTRGTSRTRGKLDPGQGRVHAPPRHAAPRARVGSSTLSNVFCTLNCRSGTSRTRGKLDQAPRSSTTRRMGGTSRTRGKLDGSPRGRARKHYGLS